MAVFRGSGHAKTSRSSRCRAAERLRLILVAAIFLPAAGCAVGPNFVSPEAPVSSKFREANSRSVQSKYEDYRDWWKSFHDPILNRLIQTAYDQNLTLLSAGTRVLQARAILGIAIGEVFPQVQQGTGSLTYNRASAATPLSAPNATPAFFWTDSVGVQAAWELDFWGKFRRGVESADGAYLASIASYDAVLVSLLGDVTATYIGIRTTEQLIAIARNNIREQKESVRIAESRFRSGSVSEARRIRGEKCSRCDSGNDTSADNPVAATTKRAVRAAWRPAAVVGGIVRQVKGPNTGAAQYGGGRYPGRSAPS